MKINVKSTFEIYKQQCTVISLIQICTKMQGIQSNKPVTTQDYIISKLI